MRLQVCELDLKLPKEVSPFELRSWLLGQFEPYGEPLRWAITAVKTSSDSDVKRVLTVEAVVLTS